MPRNTQKPKRNNPIQLDIPSIPAESSRKCLLFSFQNFDRQHPLFNLGTEIPSDTLSGSWFLDMLDCLKSIAGMSHAERVSSIHKLHPVKWKTANTRLPKGYEQQEFWQFRINKSKGRIIGFLVNDVFYIVWLDPYHNLTNSERYGEAVYYDPGLSDYERLERNFQILQQENESLKAEIDELKEIIES